MLEHLGEQELELHVSEDLDVCFLSPFGKNVLEHAHHEQLFVLQKKRLAKI